MESPSRLRYVAAALLGILGVGSFVGIVIVMVSHDPWAGLAILPLFVAGVVLIACALFVLSDVLEAWLLAMVVTGLLAFPAINYVLSVRGRVWVDPVGLAVDVTVVVMVLVIVARAIEARRDRESDARAIEAWRRSRNRGDR